MKKMTKKCGNCGLEIAESEIYCEKCKEQLDIDSIIAAKHETDEEYLEGLTPSSNREKILAAVERADELEEFVTSHKAGGSFEHSPEELEKKRKHREEVKRLKKIEMKRWIIIFTVVILGGLGIAFSLRDRYSRIDSICAPQFFNGSIYYANTADNNRLYMMREDGTEKQLLSELSVDNFVIYENKDGKKDIYYSAPGFGIYRLDSSGKNELLLETSAQYIYPVENGFYYIPDFNGLRNLSFFESEKKMIRRLSGRFSDNMIYTADGILFRGKNTEGNIWLNVNGVDIRILPETVKSFELAENKIVYISADKNNNIYAIDYTAGDQLRAADGKLLIKENVSRLKLSDGWVYYTEGTTGNLYKCRIDGSENSQLTTKPIDHFMIYQGKVIGYMKNKLVMLDTNTKKIFKLD